RPDPAQQKAEVQRPDTLPEKIEPAAPAIRLYRGSWTTTGVVLLLAAAVAAMQWRPWRKPGTPTHRRIATISAFETAASFSPDTAWVTFVKNDAAGVAQVWIQNVVQGESLQITSGNVPASHPRWSPKNDEIVFDRGEESKSIWSVPIFGGLAPTQLIG